ncbi:unnamed protein product [Allacma fusca]|uniref:Uncharacterized protein n=1 Tax=Allacma fusca TaxID=39272 RepID=A0A8J2L364_9HEXA|nr:unnamed protein product [Allacma fusca]
MNKLRTLMRKVIAIGAKRMYVCTLEETSLFRHVIQGRDLFWIRMENHQGLLVASIYSLTKDEARENETSPSYKKTSGRTVHLSEYSPTFSVLLPLVDGKAFVNETEALNYFKYLHHGEFFVEAPEGWGISAVVQILRLATVFGNHGKCLDYIQFWEETSGENRTSPKICGTIEPQHLLHQPSESKLIGPRSYVTESSKLGVEIFIFSSTIHTEWTLGDSHLIKTLTVEISFTAFPLGDNVVLDDTNSDDVPAEPSNTTSEITICSRFQSLYEKFNLTGDPFKPCQNRGPAKEIFCIHQSLFCDGILHCPSNQTNLVRGHDEKSNCSQVLLLTPVEVGPGRANQTSRDTRLIPRLASKDQPLKIKIAHWSIIGVGCIIVMIFLIGLLRSLKRNRLCSGDDPEVSESGTESSTSEGPQRRRQFELIERFLNLRKKAMHAGVHAKI